MPSETADPEAYTSHPKNSWAPEIPLPLHSAALPPSYKPHSKSLTFLLLTPSLAVIIPILLLP